MKTKVNYLKNDLQKLNDTFLNVGKVRAQILTIEGLSTIAKKYLRLSKKEPTIYKAIETAIWFNTSNKTNGKELLKTAHKLATYTNSNLMEFAKELATKRLQSEINSRINKVTKSTELLAELQLKSKTAPLYGDLIIKVEKQIDGLNKQIDILQAR